MRTKKIMNIITIDKFVPEKICQAMVEGFDAANAENTLTYYRGDNINCIEVDMLNQSKNGINDQVKEKWKHYIKEFTNATIKATNKWLESMNDEELKERIKKLTIRLEEETNKSNPDKDLASIIKTDLINALRELVKRMESVWKRKNYN